MLLSFVGCDLLEFVSRNVSICLAPPIRVPASLIEEGRRPSCILWLAGSSISGSDDVIGSCRDLEGVSDAISGVEEVECTLLVEKWRGLCLPSVLALMGATIPGKASPDIVLILVAPGVGLGSTDTTDRIGKTRSVASGLNASKEDSLAGCG